MQITAEEKWMYSAKKAIYDSGIPIDFKGSMVLKACLIEAGYRIGIDDYMTKPVNLDELFLRIGIGIFPFSVSVCPLK